jgi:hypothetical protein
MTWVALNYPPSFLPLYVRSMPQQLETSPPKEKEVVLHTIEGVPPDQFARALLTPVAKQEQSGTDGPRGLK